MFGGALGGTSTTDAASCEDTSQRDATHASAPGVTRARRHSMQREAQDSVQRLTANKKLAEFIKEHQDGESQHGRGRGRSDTRKPWWIRYGSCSRASSLCIGGSRRSRRACLRAYSGRSRRYRTRTRSSSARAAPTEHPSGSRQWRHEGGVECSLLVCVCREQLYRGGAFMWRE